MKVKKLYWDWIYLDPVTYAQCGSWIHGRVVNHLNSDMGTEGWFQFDTGATGIAVDKNISDNLGLEETKFTREIRTAGGLVSEKGVKADIEIDLIIAKENRLYNLILPAIEDTYIFRVSDWSDSLKGIRKSECLGVNLITESYHKNIVPFVEMWRDQPALGYVGTEFLAITEGKLIFDAAYGLTTFEIDILA